MLQSVPVGCTIGYVRSSLLFYAPTGVSGLIHREPFHSGVVVTKPDSKPEPDWVEAARGGDTDALGWLYEQYSDRIYSYVYVRLGDHAEAEDVTGQVFLKMIEKIGEFKWQGAGFAAWLFKIAHNQVIDTRRKHSRQQHVPMDGTGVLLPADGANDGTDPQLYAERRDFLG